MWKERAKKHKQKRHISTIEGEERASSTHLWLQNLHLWFAMVAANSVSSLPTDYSDTCNFLNKNLLNKNSQFVPQNSFNCGQNCFGGSFQTHSKTLKAFNYVP